MHLDAALVLGVDGELEVGCAQPLQRVVEYRPAFIIIINFRFITLACIPET